MFLIKRHHSCWFAHEGVLNGTAGENSGISLAKYCLFILFSREREGIVVSDRSSISLASAILFVVLDQLTRGNRALSGEVADVGQHYTNMMLIQS